MGSSPLDLALHYHLENDDIFMAGPCECKRDEKAGDESGQTLGQQFTPLQICAVICCGARLGVGELRLDEITQRWIADENMQRQQD